MRYLLLSLCLLCFACRSYPKKHNLQPEKASNEAAQNPYFSDISKDYVYKANIDVYKKSFSGIFIVKKLGDENHRMVFTTEMGNKIFDFSFSDNDFKVNFILEELDKKILINILKNDFKVLIEEQPLVNKTFTSDQKTIFETTLNNKTYYYINSSQLDEIIRVKNGKEKVVFLFLEINNNIANKIKIVHKNIKLKIHLKSIN